MILGELLLGAREWLWPAIFIAAAVALLVTLRYWQAATLNWVRVVCWLLKLSAIALLAACLVDPQWSGSRPKPGQNLFLVVADNSRSLQLANPGERQSRGEVMRRLLNKESDWLTRLAQDFDVRRYTFDSSLEPVQDFETLSLAGESSAIANSVTSLATRFRGQPVAGILLLTDGNATDLVEQSGAWKNLPTVFPVALANDSAAVDLAVTRVSVSQTNFEAAPVTIAAEIESRSLSDREIVVRVLDETGKEVERRTIKSDQTAQRFLIKPEKPGVSFYTVQASVASEEKLEPGSRTIEATLANNRRLAVVDRGGGPYRVLYVSGMPNWEFKFLRRAMMEDDEVHFRGLLRLAKKEPKFTFLGRSGERTNPLFRGFGNDKDEKAEQYDEPVLVRIGTDDKEELRGGFPKDAQELFKYHAIILDDIEAAFFSQDQLSLLQQFVSQRGGGLLMTGGKGSFGEGGYARTPVGEMLPVYLDRASPLALGDGFQLRLSREGWLQPWLRVRANEQEELQRLTGMPPLKSLNRIDAIKPAAAVLAEVDTASGDPRPALVSQPFGRGQVAALLVGDLWRWGLRRPDPDQSDLEKSWRQMVRWLVSEVPQPVEVETRRTAEPGLAPTEILVRARDGSFEPLDNATVKIVVHTPDKRQIEIAATGSESKSGEYLAAFAPRMAGAYRAQVTVTAADGSEVGRRETGWAVEPETEEFRKLTGNRALLEMLAKESGGEVIEPNSLGSFVSSLPNRKIPIVEHWTYPLWHQWQILAIAVGCLIGEWGLRRWKGLP